MNHDSRNDEIREYNEFMFKLTNKAREINEDFQKLSPHNKEQVNATLRSCISFEAIMQFLYPMNRQ